MTTETPRNHAASVLETSKGGSPVAAARSAPSISVHAIQDVAALSGIKTEWERLADLALEPSLSSEHWMLIPAIRYVATGCSITVLTMRVHDSARPDHGELCAVFPLEVRDRHMGLPIRTVRLWDHIYSLSPTPLLHRDYAEHCVRALFKWISDSYPTRTLIEFPSLATNSAFTGMLVNVLRKDDFHYLTTDMYCRAFFRREPKTDNDEDAPESKHRRTRRLERRLSETGELTYDILKPTFVTNSWVEEFVALEMKGWKGSEGSAFGCDDRHHAFLSEIVAAAQERGHLMALSLRLDGRALAMKLNFLCNPGGYLFKTVYDEEFAKYTPGTLLEIENTRLIREITSLAWMDSLAAPNHPMIDRLWHDRVTIVSLLVSTGSWTSDLLLSARFLIRMFNRRITRMRGEHAGP